MSVDFSKYDEQLSQNFVIAQGMEPMRVGKPLPPDYRAKYGHVFPETAFWIWERFGFDGFAKGQWWFTDPIEWRPVVDAWLKDVDLGFDDVFHCVACNAIGCLSLWGERTWRTLWVQAPVWQMCVWMEEFDYSDYYFANDKISQILTTPVPIDLDSTGEDIFAECYQELGELKPGEIYGDPGARFLVPGNVYAWPMEKVEAIPFLVDYASIRPRQMTFLRADGTDPALDKEREEAAKWLITDPTRKEFWDVLRYPTEYDYFQD